MLAGAEAIDDDALHILAVGDPQRVRPRVTKGLEARDPPVETRASDMVGAALAHTHFVFFLMALLYRARSLDPDRPGSGSLMPFLTTRFCFRSTSSWLWVIFLVCPVGLPLGSMM